MNVLKSPALSGGLFGRGARVDLNGFFNLLYDSAPEGSHILVWQPPADGKGGGRSYWMPSIEQAVSVIKTQRERTIYFQVGLSGGAYKPNQRCTTDESDGRPVVALPAVYADIDIKGPAHQKQNLPPTLEDAMALVHGHGFDPTCIVHSGNGLQAYWVFKECWELDEDSRPDAMALLRRVKRFIKERSAEHGWDADSVQDLVRVLRPPESYNYKDGKKEVRVIECDENRCYNPEDLAEFLPEDPGEEKSSGSGSGSVCLGSGEIKEMSNALCLNENAQPPTSKWMSLLDIHGAKLKAIWDCNLDDQADQSPSGWDYSLALYAAQAEWSPQEIADLLIAHREAHGFDLKLKNIQYYSRTIISARKKARDESLENKSSAKNLAKESQIEARFEENDPRRDISLQLGTSIVKIKKYEQEPPIYELITPTKEIELGDVTYLIKQDKLRRRLAEHTGHLVPQIKPERWQEVAQILLDICKTVTVSDDSTNTGRMGSWLSDYLADKDPAGNTEQVANTKAPFVYKNTWHIFGKTFFRFIRNSGAEIDQRNMSRQMKRIGCDQVGVNFKINKNWANRSVWSVPCVRAPLTGGGDDDDD